MPTPGERKALIFIASLAALGVAARGWQQLHPQNPEPLAGNRSALARQIQAVDSAIAVTSSKRKPRTPSPHIDTVYSQPKPRANRKTVHITLPLDTVPKTGREMYRERIARMDSIRIALSSPPPSVTRHLPTHPSPVTRPLSSRSEQFSPVDLDTAPQDEIANVAVIGGALARRIVQNRIADGPFGSLEELERIPGISAGLGRRLSPYVTFSLPPRHGSAGKNVRSKGAPRGPAPFRP